MEWKREKCCGAQGCPALLCAGPGREIITSGFASLIRGRPDMNTLVREPHMIISGITLGPKHSTASCHRSRFSAHLKTMCPPALMPLRFASCLG